ncbi:MAG: hypothetical protein V4625_08440 [Pseudomonadota bacterium]
MNDIKGLTLACTVVTCVVLLGSHALMARLWLARYPATSPQKATALLGLALNVPLVVAIVGCGVWAKASSAELGLALLYATLAFNSVAYSYFHFFNLSETGRRIRMLLQLLEGDRIGTSDSGSTSMYGGRAMVSQRLVRLLQMGQIDETGGRYRITGQFLLNSAKLVRLIGRMTTGRTV